MSYSAEEIKDKLGGRLIGKAGVKKLVCETLKLLPAESVDYLTANVWFISSFEDAWGFTMRGDELHGKHLIFLSDELFLETREHAVSTILHEVGHVILNHRNAILEPQESSETEKQEKEADAFARRYL